MLAALAFPFLFLKFIYILKYYTKDILYLFFFFLSSTNIYANIYTWYLMQYLPFHLFDLVPKPPNYLVGWMLFSPMAPYSELWFLSGLVANFSSQCLSLEFFSLENMYIYIYILLNDPVGCIKWFSIWAPQHIPLPWILSH